MEKKKFDKVAYNNSYIAKSYDRVNLILPRGKKQEIKAAAETAGESVNAYIYGAICQRMGTTADDTTE